MKASLIATFAIALVAATLSTVTASPAPALATAAPPNPARRDFSSDIALASTNPLAIPGIVQSLIDNTAYLSEFQAYTSANTGAYSSILAQASTQLGGFVPTQSVSNIIGAVQSSISNAVSSYSVVKASQGTATSSSSAPTSTASRPDGALGDASPAHLAAFAAAGAAALVAMLV